MSHTILIWSVTIAQVFLAIAMALAAFRMFRGPRAQDRVLALDTLYLNSMLLLMVFGIRTGKDIYFEASLVIGMLANKDAEGFLAPLWPWIGSIKCLPVSGHEAHDAAMFAALAAKRAVPCTQYGDVAEAVAAIAEDSPPHAVLIAGSLYLAGEVLSANGQEPD